MRVLVYLCHRPWRINATLVVAAAAVAAVPAFVPSMRIIA